MRGLGQFSSYDVVVTDNLVFQELCFNCRKNHWSEMPTIRQLALISFVDE